jgi:hypothetical protein
MGCTQALPRTPPVKDIPVANTAGMDSYTKFEYSFPLYRTRIDVFEGRLKRFVISKESVSFAQLRYAFKDDKNWSDL